MWEHLTSPAGRWVYGVIMGLLALMSKWCAKVRKEKQELIDKVNGLEGKIKSVDGKVASVDNKLDTEISERRERERKLDERFEKLDEKMDTKFDKFGEALNQVVLNTAVNAAKIDK